MRPGRWSIASAILAAAFLIGSFSSEIADTDFWWHLKTGQYVFEQHRLPVPDPFSYTSDLGEPAYPGEEQVRRFNLTHEWLSQLVWYLIYRLGGFPGVILWKALLLTFVCATAGFLATQRSKNTPIGILASLAGVPILTLFAVDRPAVLTFAFVALFVLILEQYVTGARARWLWLLPPLQLVWANSHGGFFLGWVVMGVYSVAAWNLADRRRKNLWLAAGAAFLLSGVNPSGFRIFEILLAYRESFLTQTLIEWKRPFLWGPPYTYNLLLYASAVAVALSWKRVRLADVLLFVAFGAASLLAFRNTPLIAFLGPVLVATYAWPMFAARLRGRLAQGTGSVISVLILLGLGGLITQQALAGRLFQMRVAEWKFPVGAAEFLRRNAVTEPMFNSYEYGGYLIWALWPQQQTFIDGRALNESVYNDYRRILYGQGSTTEEVRRSRERLLERYGTTVVVTNAFEYVTGAIYPIVLSLADPGYEQWQLIYEDPQAVVFARDVPENRALIEKHGLPKSRIAGHLETACRTYIEHDPELPNCARRLGFLFSRMGNRERAERNLSLYFDHIDYRDPEAEQLYSRLRNGP